MGTQPVQKEGRFTYSDYLRWPAEERWEIIDGRAWAMSPSPTELHQRTSSVLFRALADFFEGRPCEVYYAPFDVVLAEGDVVQPDILVVCDPAKITSARIAGAPDLVVEILSPATAAKDRREKFDLYERHGVREYLIVHPEERLIEQFALGDDGRYGRPTIFGPAESYRSAIFDGLVIDLARVFR